MKQTTKTPSNILCKEVVLFCIGGISYSIVEFLFKTFISKGTQSWTMMIVGGLAFILIGLINEVFPWSMLFQYQVIIGVSMVTALEYYSGLLINIKLNMHVWDYSQLPFNLNGQICLQFIIAWVPLVAGAIYADDALRYKLWNEEKPRYYFTKKQVLSGHPTIL